MQRKFAIGLGAAWARCRRTTLFGAGQAVLTASAILVGGGAAFVLLRSWLSQLPLPGQSPPAALALASQPTSSGPRVKPPPPIEEIIADVVKWQPPVAEGKPSPLDSRAALPIVSADHVLGSQHAPITLMAFGDFQCRYAMHTLRVLLRLVEEQPSRYRLVWRECPLDIHPEATSIARQAEELAVQSGELAFWRFVHAMSRLRGTVTPSNSTAIAAMLQQGAASHDAKLTQRAAAQLDSDERIAVAYAVRASPTVFLNGLRLEGDVVEGELAELVDEELVAVNELLQEPVPQAKVYMTRVHANLLDLDAD